MQCLGSRPVCGRALASSQGVQPQMPRSWTSDLATCLSQAQGSLGQWLLVLKAGKRFAEGQVCRAAWQL